MQLVAYGAQDIYLTGNPQITFFKVVYRRHTNFSMEAIEQTWNGSSETSGRCTAVISRNGDLVHRMYVTHSTALPVRLQMSLVQILYPMQNWKLVVKELLDNTVTGCSFGINLLSQRSKYVVTSK